MNFRKPEMPRLMKMILWKKSRENLQAQGEELAFQLRYVSKNEKKILQGVAKMLFLTFGVVQILCQGCQVC